MNRTQNSPKRRQEKQLSARRKHWNHIQVTDRPSPDAPSLITLAIVMEMVHCVPVSVQCKSIVMIRERASLMKEDDVTDLNCSWSTVGGDEIYLAWAFGGRPNERNNHDHTINFSSPSVYLTSQGASDDLKRSKGSVWILMQQISVKIWRTQRTIEISWINILWTAGVEHA